MVPHVITFLKEMIAEAVGFTSLAKPEESHISRELKLSWPLFMLTRSAYRTLYLTASGRSVFCAAQRSSWSLPVRHTHTMATEIKTFNTPKSAQRT